MSKGLILIIFQDEGYHKSSSPKHQIENYIILSTLSFHPSIKKKLIKSLSIDAVEYNLIA
jgi:hypothetical protein